VAVTGLAKTPKLLSIKPQRDEKLVEALKDWLKDAESGELMGCVLLGNRRGDEVQHQWVGDFPLGKALLAVERFKRSALDYD
jgi:hypothetical protein